jgi:OmpA-OmpF porin, OOP family
MNTKALLTLLALLGWILFCNWWWCNNKEQCDCDKNAIAAAPAVVDDGIIRFNTSDAATITNAQWPAFRDSIANLINTGKRLEIVGYYGSQEKNNSKFENLGIARAEAVKADMMKQFSNINPSRIACVGVVKDDLNTVTPPFVATNFNIKDTIATPSDAGGVVATDSNDILVYFPTGSATKEPSKEVDDFLTKLGARLSSSGEKAIVTGHTDNKGVFAKNLQLSKDRAAFVKTILVKHSAIEANISTDGKADKEPIGDNATDAGRRQNRRVRIQISK